MITLFVGGAGSGKSEIAERYTATLAPPVTYVATWRPPAGARPDEDMDARVAAHRARRPEQWGLCEVGDELPDVLRSIVGTALVDALGTWVACAPQLSVDAGALCSALVERISDTVVVTDEVGFGVHPSTPIGGRFRDELGRLNRAVASVADDVWLVVAGRVARLSAPAW
ncbi:MAG: bifunctional adenosylcobinamide kinase/adenosylcobinamide-phosphate guanylyltransferase [Acidimicrobiales bacterium]